VPLASEKKTNTASRFDRHAHAVPLTLEKKTNTASGFDRHAHAVPLASEKKTNTASGAASARRWILVEVRRFLVPSSQKRSLLR
jgi:hypothetical protein